MDRLNDLKEARSTGAYRLRFGAAVEAQYRLAARRLGRYPLTAMFLVLGLSFALAPFYQVSVFGVSPELVARGRPYQWFLMFPVMTAAAAATFFEAPRMLTAPLQAIGVVIMWMAALILRHFALLHQMTYPSSMVALIVIAIAMFGRMNWYPVSLGSIAVLIFASLQEFHIQGVSPETVSRAYAYGLAGLITVSGAYVIELGHRLSWINWRSAKLLARLDVLTGLFNRKEFNRLYPRAFKECRRQQRPMAIAILDVDQFKCINDTYGHGVGDDVLQSIGRVLACGVTRHPLDLVVRLGGEEFVMVWCGVDEDEATRRSEEVLAAIRTISVERGDGADVWQVTASIGVSWLVPGPESTHESVLQHADQQMYRAKDKGRNRVVIGPFLSCPATHISTVKTSRVRVT